MPPRNYCRDALVQHCLTFSADNVAAAVKLLNNIVRNQIDFLAPWACIPKSGIKKMNICKYIDTRFNAQTWVDTHVKAYKIPSTVDYIDFLAEAYLRTRGLEIPWYVWENDKFVEAFRNAASAMLSLRVPPRQHNLEHVRQHTTAGPIVTELEAQYPSEVTRLLQLHDYLLESLHSHGIPPTNVIYRLLGQDAVDICLHALENIETKPCDLDVDMALQSGIQRQKQNEHVWDRVSCKRAVTLLQIYTNGILQGKSSICIGEDYDQYRKEQTLQHHNQYQERIETAKQLGVWRIRRSEISLWRSSLLDEQWKIYQQCELLMSNTLPVGVYSEIPRRYFNKSSLKHMQTVNLALLQSKFLEDE